MGIVVGWFVHLFVCDCSPGYHSSEGQHGYSLHTISYIVLIVAYFDVKPSLSNKS